MFCYVDMEHASEMQDTASQNVHADYVAHVKHKLETISGEQCIVQPYHQLTLEWLAQRDFSAVIFSGNAANWEVYDQPELEHLYTIIRQLDLPVLGFCGGVQLIALAHGAEVGPLRKLESGEVDIAPQYKPGLLKEWSFTPLTILESTDPLFGGLPEQPVFLDSHSLEVKTIPSEFDLLASTLACRVQVLRHKSKPMYGVQFHPEAYIEEPQDADNWLINMVYPQGYSTPQPDGRKLIENFFKIAGASGR